MTDQYPPPPGPDPWSAPGSPPGTDPWSAPGPPPVPPPAYLPPTPQRPTNGMAIAALVLALISLLMCGLGLPVALAGVVLGILALRRITARDERGRGLAIAGIVIGGVAAAMSVLLGLLVLWASNQPSDTAARDLVRTTLRNAATAQERYRADNDTYAPTLSELRTEDYRPTDGVAVTIRWANAGGFCMEGVYGSAELYITEGGVPAVGTCAFADRPS